MRFQLLTVAATLFTAMTLTAHGQTPAPVTPESLVTAAKRAAGRDHAGTFLRICVAPDNLGGGAPRPPNAAPGARTVPDRATWYAQPYKVFDDLYFIGTQVHSAWALTTSEGIIVIDTLFDYAIEPEMVEGLTQLGLDPRDIKYVLISHAHGDHDQGAHSQVATAPNGDKGRTGLDAAAPDRPGGVPKRDVAIRTGGLKITLGDTTVDVIATPGHARYSVYLPGKGPTGPDGGLLRRHGFQLSAPSGELRHLPRQRQENGRSRERGGRHGLDDQSHRVRPRLRPRAHRPAAAPGEKHLRRCTRPKALFRNAETVPKQRLSLGRLRNVQSGHAPLGLRRSLAMACGDCLPGMIGGRP
jgi:hypothetical protein